MRNRASKGILAVILLHEKLNQFHIAHSANFVCVGDDAFLNALTILRCADVAIKRVDASRCLAESVVCFVHTGSKALVVHHSPSSALNVHDGVGV